LTEAPKNGDDFRKQNDGPGMCFGQERVAGG